jgi:hypothetical protein
MTALCPLPTAIAPATFDGPLGRHLTEALETMGYEVGPPPHITPATLRIDATSCKRRRCNNCGHRGLDFVPWHRGQAYKVVGTCPACLVAEEF